MWKILLPLLAVAAMSDAVDDKLIQGVAANLRVFRDPRTIGTFSSQCRNFITNFGKCVIKGGAENDPQNCVGAKLLQKPRQLLENMRKHPNVKSIVEIDKRIRESCFEVFIYLF